MKPTCSLAGIVLEVECDKCNGAGVVMSEAWKAWTAAWRAAQAEGQEAPPMPNEPEEVPCPDCGGDGRLLTAEGAELIKFISRWKYVNTERR